MGTNLIDLRQVQEASDDKLPGLHATLSQLVGEPFRFARVSYADELTIHFGDLRLARSPKLKEKFYGAYILGLRASAWVLKSGLKPLVITAGVVFDVPSSALGMTLNKKDLESGAFIEPESRVLSATPFVVKPAGGFGLQLRMSDGSTLTVLPAAPEPDEENLPRLLNWGLLSPRGLLGAGPDLRWIFTPSRNASPQQKSEPDA